MGAGACSPRVAHSLLGRVEAGVQAPNRACPWCSLSQGLPRLFVQMTSTNHGGRKRQTTAGTIKTPVLRGPERLCDLLDVTQPMGAGTGLCLSWT